MAPDQSTGENSNQKTPVAGSDMSPWQVKGGETSGSAAEPDPNSPAAAEAEATPVANPVPPAQPEAALSSGAFAAQQPHLQPPRSKKTGLFVTLAVVLVALLGSFTAWALYNRPANAVSDSLLKLANSKQLALEGKIESFSSPRASLSGDLKIRFNAARNWAADGILTIRDKQPFGVGPVNLNLSVIAEGSQNFFVKVNNAKGTVEQLAGGGASGKMVAGSLSNFLSVVDGRWIRFNNSTVSQETIQADQCFQKTFADLSKNAAERNKLRRIYRQNMFVAPEANLPAEVIGGRGSSHYKLRFDEAKAMSLARAVMGTDTYRRLQACNKDFTINLGEIPNVVRELNQLNVETWVDYWTHDITRLSYDNKKGDKGYFDFKYSDAATTVVVPSDSVPYQDALNALRKDFGSSGPAATWSLPGLPGATSPSVFQL